MLYEVITQVMFIATANSVDTIPPALFRITSYNVCYTKLLRKRQCDNARRYLTLSERLKSLEINKFLVLYKQFTDTITSLKDEQKNLEEIEKQSISNTENTKKSIADAQKQLDESNLVLEDIQQKINVLPTYLFLAKASP